MGSGQIHVLSEGGQFFADLQVGQLASAPLRNTAKAFTQIPKVYKLFFFKSLIKSIFGVVLMR